VQNVIRCGFGIGVTQPDKKLTQLGGRKTSPDD